MEFLYDFDEYHEIETNNYKDKILKNITNVENIAYSKNIRHIMRLKHGNNCLICGASNATVNAKAVKLTGTFTHLECCNRLDESQKASARAAFHFVYLF